LTVRQQIKNQMDKDSILCDFVLGQSVTYFKKSKSHEYIQYADG